LASFLKFIWYLFKIETSLLVKRIKLVDTSINKLFLVFVLQFIKVGNSSPNMDDQYQIYDSQKKNSQNRVVIKMCGCVYQNKNVWM